MGREDVRGDERRAVDGAVDVLVVGGGLAGWVAATAAQEAGATVALVECARRGPGWSNSIISGGALHTMLRDPRTAPDELESLLTAATDGHADPVVVRSWAQHAARTVRWLEAHDARLEGDPSQPHRAKVFAPVRLTEPGTRWAGFGVGEFLQACRTRFVAAGGVVVQPARARRLAPHPDGGWLVEVRPADGQPTHRRAGAVVLADGGFQGNAALLRRYVGTDQVRRRGTGTGRGDGLRMGLANGGVAVNMQGFYGHLLARASLERDDLWPYPILDLLAAVGIVVTRRGTRLVDEASGGVTLTNEVAWSDDPLGCCIVVDDDAWRTEGAIGVTPPDPWLLDHGAVVHTAPTVPALAAAAGIDPDGLAAAVAHATGTAPGPAGAPARTGTVKLATPPFHAVPVVAGVTFTLGGLRVGAHGEVLDATGAPRPGLYAAGGTMGGLHGGPRVGYAGGLLEAAVFGLLAGEHAAAGARGVSATTRGAPG